MTASTRYSSACTCGHVALEATGAPILTATCFCHSCRSAAKRFEEAPGAPSVLNRDGGIDYSLFRKDRVAVVHGNNRLRAHKLTETSPTRRVVATCCNAPMFLDFTPGHWLSLYRDRLPDAAPAPEIAVMTGDLPPDHPQPCGLRAYAGRPPRFIFRLLTSFAAMRFRSPMFDWG
jgi:hypothetical protein